MERLLEILRDEYVTLVSYGLAPNPNGFCYEVDYVEPDSQPSREILLELGSLLDSLSRVEVIAIRQEFLEGA